MANYADKNGKDKTPRNKSGVGPAHAAPFRGYVNLNLDENQKAGYAKWSSSASLWEVLEASVADGVQISLKLDPKGQGYLASGTQRNPASPNAGLVVTARARDAGTALGRLLYCLVFLGHKDRWEDTQPVSDPDRW